MAYEQVRDVIMSQEVTPHSSGGQLLVITTLTGPRVWPVWTGGSRDTGTGTTDSVRDLLRDNPRDIY